MTFNEVEQARQKYAKKLLLMIVSLGVIFLVVVSLVFFLPLMIISASGKELRVDDLGGAGVIVLMAAMFAIPVGAWVLGFKRSNSRRIYEKYYKAYFVKTSLRNILDNVKYDHEQGIDSQVLRDTRMIRMGNVYNSDDWTMAEYKGLDFVQADVEIGDSDTDGSRTLFKGRWMIFGFPKKFNFRLKVIEKWFPSDLRYGNMRRVEVESQDFNDLFKIYAEDDFEAFYLLDPALLEGITRLGKNYKGKIMLCFVENKLHVALHDRKDAFEPPRNVFKPLDEQAEMEKVAGEIKVVTDFVDGLRLDKKLFQ